MTLISALATARKTPTWNMEPVRMAADQRNIQSRLHLWLDMMSRGTPRGRASPVTRTLTPFRRSVMNRQDVHQHAKIQLVAREYRESETGRRNTVAGTRSVSVEVVAVNSTYPRELKMLNH